MGVIKLLRMQKTKIKIFFKFFLLSGLLFLLNCKGEESEKGKQQDSLQIRNTDKTFKFKNKLFSIPSPFVASDLIKQISDDYNSDFLNPAENKNNYTTTSGKALNLGVYTADLAYTNIYEQFSATTKYIKVVRSLSSELQIMNSYTDEVLEDFENNLNDKDSLNKIFTNAYRETELYLSENNRENIADLVLTGSWVEGLYIMTQITKEKSNKELINRIGEQKYSLKNLLNILNNDNRQTEQNKKLVSKLRDLNNEYNKINIKYKYFNQIVVPKEKKSVILSETEIEITPEILKNITDKVTEIRKLIIK